MGIRSSRLDEPNTEELHNNSCLQRSRDSTPTVDNIAEKDISEVWIYGKLATDHDSHAAKAAILAICVPNPVLVLDIVSSSACAEMGATC
jgi:hypothetical protein